MVTIAGGGTRIFSCGAIKRCGLWAPNLDQTPEIEDLEAEIAVLQESIRENPAAPLTKYLKRSGAFQGEIVDFTPDQFRELRGETAPQSIRNTQGNVPWELTLDVVASELGFRSDELLKEEIERMGRAKRRLQDLRTSRRQAVSRVPSCEPIETALVPCEGFPERDCPVKTVSCGDNFAIAVRHPVQWSIHSDFPAGPENELERVRTAGEASKIIRQEARFPGGFE